MSKLSQRLEHQHLDDSIDVKERRINTLDSQIAAKELIILTLQNQHDQLRRDVKDLEKTIQELEKNRDILREATQTLEQAKSNGVNISTSSETSREPTPKKALATKKGHTGSPIFIEDEEEDSEEIPVVTRVLLNTSGTQTVKEKTEKVDAKKEVPSLDKKLEQAVKKLEKDVKKHKKKQSWTKSDWAMDSGLLKVALVNMDTNDGILKENLADRLTKAMCKTIGTIREYFKGCVANREVIERQLAVNMAEKEFRSYVSEQIQTVVEHSDHRDDFDFSRAEPDEILTFAKNNNIDWDTIEIGSIRLFELYTQCCTTTENYIEAFNDAQEKSLEIEIEKLRKKNEYKQYDTEKDRLDRKIQSFLPCTIKWEKWKRKSERKAEEESLKREKNSKRSKKEKKDTSDVKKRKGSDQSGKSKKSKY